MAVISSAYGQFKPTVYCCILLEIISIGQRSSNVLVVLIVAV